MTWFSKKLWTHKKCAFWFYWNLNISQKIFKKYSNIIFQENPSSGSQVVPCGQTWQRQHSLFIILWTCQKWGKLSFNIMFSKSILPLMQSSRWLDTSETNNTAGPLLCWPFRWKIRMTSSSNNSLIADNNLLGRAVWISGSLKGV
jgi:hypothetical protein